jgi:hypothetical protein
MLSRNTTILYWRLQGAGKDPSIAAAQGEQPFKDPHFEGESAFKPRESAPKSGGSVYEPGSAAGAASHANKQRSWNETGAN